MTTNATPALRIYWLTTEFFPPETGRTGMIAARLAQGLAERGVGIQSAMNSERLGGFSH
jgi:hypothetical protein